MHTHLKTWWVGGRKKIRLKVAPNNVVSQLPKRRPTGTPAADAKIGQRTQKSVKRHPVTKKVVVGKNLPYATKTSDNPSSLLIDNLCCSLHCQDWFIPVGWLEDLKLVYFSTAKLPGLLEIIQSFTKVFQSVKISYKSFNFLQGSTDRVFRIINTNNKLGLSCVKLSLSWFQAYYASD